MESWQKDTALIVVGWILGLFTLPIAKDIEVKEKCLNSLYEIKRLLEKLSRHMRSPTRSENGYYALLMEIKPVIERLDVAVEQKMIASWQPLIGSRWTEYEQIILC